MPIAAVLVASLIVMSGCQTYRHALIVAGVGTTTLVGGALLTEYPCAFGKGPEGGTGPYCYDNVVLGLGGGVIGGVVVLGALINLAYLAATADDRRAADAQATRDEDDDAAELEFERKALRVRMLGKKATTAARAGDCDAVRTIALKLQVLDSKFHNTIFLGNFEIKRCLAPVVEPPTDPAPALQAPPPVAPVQP